MLVKNKGLPFVSDLLETPRSLSCGGMAPSADRGTRYMSLTGCVKLPITPHLIGDEDNVRKRVQEQGRGVEKGVEKGLKRRGREGI